jgi:hypothetical protein
MHHDENSYCLNYYLDGKKNKTKTLLKKKEAKFARAAIFTFLLVCAAAAYLKYYCKFPAAAFLSRA